MDGFFHRLMVSVRNSTVASDVEQIKTVVTRILRYFQGHEGSKIFTIHPMARSPRTKVVAAKHYPF